MPLILLVGISVVFGLTLRVIDLGFPEYFTWDEHHFVKNARNYLAHQADGNDHPPLGKLIIALSMSWGGDTPFYWRLPSALFGALSVFFGALLARRVFQDDLAALLAAAFLALDGFLIVYSRAALLDGMLVSLSLFALVVMSWRHPLSYLLSGVIVGSAMAIKISGLTLMAPLLLLAAYELFPVLRRLFREEAPFLAPPSASWGTLRAASALLGGGVAIWIYLQWWSFGLQQGGQASGFKAALRASNKMMAHHAELNDWTHSLLSHWYTWALPSKPILLQNTVVSGGLVRRMTMMGNPLLWWSAAACFLGTLAFSVTRMFRSCASPSSTWIALTALAFLSPWMFTKRDSYLYHYLPVYALLLILLAGAFGRWIQEAVSENRSTVLRYLALVFVVSAYYAPVWAQLPITKAAAAARPFTRSNWLR